MSVRKYSIESKKYILMYSVLGHSRMLFNAFETKSGAIAYLRKQNNVCKFTIMPIVEMFDFQDFKGFEVN